MIQTLEEPRTASPVLPSWCLAGLRAAAMYRHPSALTRFSGSQHSHPWGLFLSALLSPLSPLLRCPPLGVLQLSLSLLSQELSPGLQMWSGWAGADAFLFFHKCNLGLLFFCRGQGARKHIAYLPRVLCPLEPFGSFLYQCC